MRKNAFAAAAGLSAMLAGCASTSNYVAPLPVEATVVNNTGQAISRIEYRGCGGANWQTLPTGPIAAGASETFELPAICTDFNAYYGDGRLAGSQRGVKREFPFKWTLS